MKKLKEKVEFCTRCGRKMEEREPITADHFGEGFYFETPFDSKTGKKRLIRWIACPKYVDHLTIFSLWGGGYFHSAHPVGREFLVDEK